MRILVTRTDRLGDTLVSLPSLIALRRAAPEAEIDFLVRQGFHRLLEGVAREFRIRLLPFCEKQTDWSFLGNPFDAAVLLHDEPGLAFRIARSKVPVRVGNRSKLRSLLWVNRGVSQHRSRAEKTEAAYCLELTRYAAECLAIPTDAFAIPVAIELGMEAADRNRGVQSVSELRRHRDRKLVILHPGMSGSAHNLSADSYATLVECFEKTGRWEVILSQGPAAEDQILVSGIQGLRGALPVLTGLSLCELSAAFASSDLVVAPSTGTLHLAHLSGVKTFGIFSGVLNQSASRWAPVGGTGKSHVFQLGAGCASPGHSSGNCASHSSLDQAVSTGDLMRELAKVLQEA